MDAMGYSRCEFSLLGTFTNMSAQFYGTNDPLAYHWYSAPSFASHFGWNVPYPGWQGNTTALPATSWFALGSPSDQSGGGGYSTNPLTAAGQFLEVKQTWLAIRCVITAAANSTGTCQAVGTAFA